MGPPLVGRLRQPSAGDLSDPRTREHAKKAYHATPKIDGSEPRDTNVYAGLFR
jgi:hypothetical protein